MNPRHNLCFALQVDKLWRDMPNKTVVEADRLHNSNVNPICTLRAQK
jgi:hypothetical protein